MIALLCISACSFLNVGCLEYLGSLGSAGSLDFPQASSLSPRPELDAQGWRCLPSCQLGGWRGEAARELPSATLSLTPSGTVPRTPRGSPRFDERAEKNQLPPSHSDRSACSIALDSEFPPGSARTSWTVPEQEGGGGRAGPHTDDPGRGYQGL